MASPAPHEEHQYLDLIREILESGEKRPDRYVDTQIVLPCE
jgi:thymidylate synthase